MLFPELTETSPKVIICGYNEKESEFDLRLCASRPEKLKNRQKSKLITKVNRTQFHVGCKEKKMSLMPAAMPVMKGTQ